MQNAVITGNKTIAMERNSITPEWVNAQDRANRRAAFGLTLSVAAPSVGTALFFGWGIDTVTLMLGIAATIGVIRYGWLNNVVFTKSEFASDEERARMEYERNEWKAEYERKAQELAEKQGKLIATAQENSRVRDQNTRLMWENSRLQERLNRRGDPVQVQAPTSESSRHDDPALSAAQTIVDLWFNDATPEHKLTTRDNLLARMKRKQVDEGWCLLHDLGIAEYTEGAGKKRSVITVDADVIYDKFEQYRNRTSQTAKGQMVEPNL